MFLSLGGLKKGSPQQDDENLRTWIGASDASIASTWRVGKDEVKPKAFHPIRGYGKENTYPIQVEDIQRQKNICK